MPAYRDDRRQKLMGHGEPRCARCGRKLTNAAAVKHRLGRGCRRREREAQQGDQA